MDYKIVAADAAIGQIQVAYTENGELLGAFAIDVPVVNGAYIQGEALDTEIRARAPLWLVHRKAAATSSTGFENISALVQAQGIVPLSLEEQKYAKSSAIDAYRVKVLSAGVVFNGYQFDSDPTSVSNLTAVVSSVSAGVSLPSGFVWRSSANIDVPMSAADLVGLLGTMIQTANTVYQTSWIKKQAISAAASQVELDAVTWSVVGIPGAV